MKYLRYSLMMALILVLTSCEVTTIKGKWQSDKYDNGAYFRVYFFDNGRFIKQLLVNDSVHSRYTDIGTWVARNDTIIYYSQNSGTNRHTIKSLSKDMITLQPLSKEKSLIMTRIYDDPNNTFFEVLKLKGGFWYYIYLIVCGGIGILLIGYVIDFIIGTIRRIKNLWYKHQNKSDK